jgi:hypothetical protein
VSVAEDRDVDCATVATDEFEESKDGCDVEEVDDDKFKRKV